jgi:hypothetical protein
MSIFCSLRYAFKSLASALLNNCITGYHLRLPNRPGTPVLCLRTIAEQVVCQTVGYENTGFHSIFEGLSRMERDEARQTRRELRPKGRTRLRVLHLTCIKDFDYYGIYQREFVKIFASWCCKGEGEQKIGKQNHQAYDGNPVRPWVIALMS